MPCRTWQPTTPERRPPMMAEVDLCRPEVLDEQLRDGNQLLLLDCRPADQYNNSHIAGAIHVAIPSLMLKRLKRGNISVSSVISGNESRDRFDRHCRTDSIVVYDERTEEVTHNSSEVVTLLTRRLAESGCRVCLLKGGFNAFKRQYPVHCLRPIQDGGSPEEQTILGLGSLRISCGSPSGGVDEVPTTPNSAATFPVEVIPYLFLGNAKNSADLECLFQNGIRYILNVTPNVANTFADNPDFKYMQIPITDHWSQNLAHYFRDAISFIDEARSQKSGVLVHCLAGVSRSVTVTVAYLMSSMSLSLNDAYDCVKRCKPNISPNFNFMGQLLDFEKMLNQGSTMCNCCIGSSSSSSSTGTGSSDTGSSAGSSASSSSASSTEGEYKCQCSRSFFTSPASTPPMYTTELSATPS